MVYWPAVSFLSLDSRGIESASHTSECLDFSRASTYVIGLRRGVDVMDNSSGTCTHVLAASPSVSLIEVKFNGK